MTSTAVLIPTGITDEWRARAREYVAQWYATNFPSAPVVFGECAPGSEWSKGEAIAAALAQTSADVLVLADADSFLLDPADLGLAIRLWRSRAGDQPDKAEAVGREAALYDVRAEAKPARNLFAFSILYLTALFAALLVERLTTLTGP